MKKNMTIIILSGLMIVLICAMAMKRNIEKSDIQLSEGFIEVNLNEREIFKEKKLETSLTISGQDITLSITPEGKIKIKIPNEEIEKTIPEEKVVGLMSDGSCAITPRSYIFALTDQNNVYRTSVFYDENDHFIPESFKGNYEKIYDGSNLKESDKVSLVQLSANNTFTTCGIQDVFLKINNKVTDFSGQLYTERYPTRYFGIGELGELNYNFDGTMEIKNAQGEMIKLKNNEGKEIKALLFGQLETGEDYMLDEEGNEYYFQKDFYTAAYENNGILNITNKNNILKIGKKVNDENKYNEEDYEIIFENKERKRVTVSYGESTFQEIGNWVE